MSIVRTDRSSVTGRAGGCWAPQWDQFLYHVHGRHPAHIYLVDLISNRRKSLCDRSIAEYVVGVLLDSISEFLV